MSTIPALIVSREEWPDADFDLPDGVPITASSDKEDDFEDWDVEMDLGHTGGAKAQAVIAGIAARSDSVSSFNSSKSQSTSSSMFTIRPPLISNTQEDDDFEDDGVSTIKASAISKPPVQATPATATIEEDFEDGLALPDDLTQLSLAPQSLHHCSSKNSLEWGDKDHHSTSSHSSDAYSTLGFTHNSPSSNSASSVSLHEIETEEDEDQDELEGIVIPAAIFESGQGGKQLNKLLEMKRKAHYSANLVKVSATDPEDDFEAGLVLDDDVDLSPSRLMRQSNGKRNFIRSNSAPARRSSISLRPPSRIRTDRAKSPTNPPPSSVRQLQKLRLSPSPPLQPPSRGQTNYQAFASASPSPSPSSAFLTPKPGSLRGQKSHSGLKPPSPPGTRNLTRKASLSSLMEMSHTHVQAPDATAGISKTRLARYEVPTAASIAKTQKSATVKIDYPLPPNRPRTPSSGSTALRLTMPNQRTKSRPALSHVFVAPATSGAPAPASTHRASSPQPYPQPARAPSSLSLRSTKSRILRPAIPTPQPSTPITPPAPKILKRPKKQKTYGDGTELDAFDDLPTDRDKESHYHVQPKGHGNRVPGGTYSSKIVTSTNTLPTAESRTLRKKKRQGSTLNESTITALGSATNTLRRTSTRIDQSSKDLAPTEPLPKKKKNGLPMNQTNRKPTLIRNLGSVGGTKVIGDMKWNPQSLRWEGNDQILKDFDSVVSTSTRPALITHLTGSSVGSPIGSLTSGARRVGNMIFDPARMCWISALPPEEDEPDVFANLADDEDDDDWDSKGGTIRASAQRPPSEVESVNTSCTSDSINPDDIPKRNHSRGASDSESDRGSRASLMVCDIDDAFIAACRAAEERHRREMKGWRSVLSKHDLYSEPDRSHLYEIRALATRRY